MQKVCEICGQEFKSTGRRKRFCSWKCKNIFLGSKWRSNGKFVKCSYCGKEIWRKNYLIKKFNRFFCNKDCQNRYKSEFADYSWCSGEKQWNWKGGISFLEKKLYKQIRKKRKYILWRKVILERDNYTCQNCGRYGNELNVDHYPKPFALIVKDNNLKNLKDMYKCKELWEISNGRTLCKTCHHKIGWRGSHLVGQNL